MVHQKINMSRKSLSAVVKSAKRSLQFESLASVDRSTHAHRNTQLQSEVMKALNTVQSIAAIVRWIIIIPWQDCYCFYLLCRLL